MLALLAAALLTLTLALGGCALGTNTTEIASYGDGETVPAGVYLYYQLTAYQNGIYQVPDYQKDPIKQEIDGVPFGDWVIQEAQESVKRHVAAELEFERLGLSLTEEETDSALAGVNAAWESSGAVFEKNGIAKSSLEAVALAGAKYARLFPAYYGEGGEKEVSEAELLSYYQENYRRITQLVFSKNGADGAPLDEAGLKELNERINRYIERFEAGESFHSLLEQKDQEDAAAAGRDPVSHEEHKDDEFYHDIVLSRDLTSYYSQEFLDAVFASDELNVPTLYEADGYFSVFIRKDLMADPDDFANGKSTLLANMKNTEFEVGLLSVADQNGMIFNDTAVKRYQPKNLKFQ